VNAFQDNIALGRPNSGLSRGARYLYICEDGLVHYCRSSAGNPAIPLEKYTMPMGAASSIYGEALCAALHRVVRPQVSVLDAWRARNAGRASEPGSGLVHIE